MQFDAFRSNPHDDLRYSRERKIRFGFDNSARLKSLDPVKFADHITATDTACSGLNLAIGRTGTAVGIGRGQTYGTDAALEAYRDVVGSQYNVVRAHLGKASEVVMTVFGSSIQRYTREVTKSNAEARMEELDKLLDANKAAVGEAVVDAIADAAEAYTGKRTIQREKLGQVGTAQVAAQAAEAVLDQQLWVNACAVVIAYPSNTDDDAARRRAAANYSLLVRPTAAADNTVRLTGSVPSQAVLNLLDPADEDALTATTPLTLTNNGPDALRFGLADSATGFDGAGAVTVGAGQTLTLTAAALGDVSTRPYFNVQNSAGTVGEYEVVVG